MRGQGTEFLQLRDYREGDSLRQIDWGAVARRDTLISREYRDEQGQQLVFLLDCGRRMRARDGIESHFDQVLNAMLLLTFVALRKGDAVGVQTFGGRDHWLAPKPGPATFQRMLDTLYAIDATLSPPDYEEAARRLLVRQRRRALIVVLTNTRDEDDAAIRVALEPLRKRHVVLVASLRETVIREILSKEVRTLDDALDVGGAALYAEERDASHRHLRAQGIDLLDVEPPDLPVGLVNAYLEIKRAQRL